MWFCSRQVSGLCGRKPPMTAKSLCWTKARHALWALEGLNSSSVWKSGTSLLHAAPPDLLIESNMAFHMPCCWVGLGAPNTLSRPAASRRTTPTFMVFPGPEHRARDPPAGPGSAPAAVAPLPPAAPPAARVPPAETGPVAAAVPLAVVAELAVPADSPVAL